MKRLIPISVDHVRVLRSPHDSKVKTMYAYVALADVPVDLPLSPNPRVPKPNEVIKRVKSSLESNDGHFHILNRGITISAKSADFDNVTGHLELDIPDGNEAYGILDGGHSYDVVKELAGHPEKADKQFVKFEIVTGVEEILPQIASARNFSKAVKDISLANYAHKLDWLKGAMGPVAPKVRWRENDDQDFDVLEYIQAITAFHIMKYDDKTHPIEAYNNAGKCLGYATDGSLEYLAPKVPDIIRLYDTIRSKWWGMYTKPDESGRGGRPGRLKEVTSRQRGTSRLMQFPSLSEADASNPAMYHVEKGLVAPLFASFRYLLNYDLHAENLSWRADPINFWDQNGPNLVRKIMDASDQRGSVPQQVGRDKTVYEALYESVELLYLKSRP